MKTRRTQRRLSTDLARVGLAIILSSCSVPGPKAPLDQVNQFPRLTWTVAGAQGQPKFTMSAHVAGDARGRRVIFLHGTPGRARGWVDYLLSVPKDLEYVAVDRPSWGNSGPRNAITSLARQAETIKFLLVRRAGRWPIIVGHSSGGPIAARAASDYPNQVGGLIILAGSMDPSLEKVELFQKIAYAFALDRLVPRWLRNTNLELLGLKPELQALRPKLGDIRCPVTIIHGTKDKLVPYENVAFMQRTMTAARMKIIGLQDQNHFLPWLEKPAIDAAIISLARKTSKTC